MSTIPCPSIKATNSSHLYFIDYLSPKTAKDEKKPVCNGVLIIARQKFKIMA